MRFLDFWRKVKKQYVRSPIDGKVMFISGGIVEIEDVVLKKIDGTILQLGDVVKKGQIIGYRK